MKNYIYIVIVAVVGCLYDDEYADQGYYWHCPIRR